MMKYLKRILVVAVVSFAIFSCESPADVELAESVPTLVVDAFINDVAEDQRIILNFSQAYFDNTLYEPASGATVVVTDDQGSEPLQFEESTEEPGVYIWSSTPARPKIGEDSVTYTLTITYDGETYQSVSEMNRTTPIEEIFFYLEEEPFSGDEFYEARMVASDLEGRGDSYWVKTFWNGEFLNDPGEINLAYDAGLSQGAEIDGEEFIIPIKIGINPIDEDESYEFGDSVRVEIHSISNETFDYLTQLQIQTDRPGGFGELFAQPLANLPTNIVPSNSEIAVLGQFSVSSISSMGVLFTESLLREIE